MKPRTPRGAEKGALVALVELVAVAVLVVLVSAIGACEEPGPLPRCYALVEWLEQCEPGCPGSDCGPDGQGEELLGLDSLDASSLASFDACLVCLKEEAEAGRCSDCGILGQDKTCRELLGDITGLSCLDP